MNKKLKIGLLFGIPALVGIYLLFKKKKGKQTYNDAKKEQLHKEDINAFDYYTVTTMVTALNVRKSPSITSEIVTKLPKDSVIIARPSSTSGWMEYSTDGTNVIGYVSADYLTKGVLTK